VSAGGCVIETPRASVDATLQTRWRRTLAAIGRDDDWVDP
jgi:flagellar biosynthesis/type III secretory pathway protein FliH